MSTIISAAPHRQQAGFDQLLGDGRRRYLSSGHRRVERRLTTAMQPKGQAYEGMACVTYPADWSVKYGQVREPHLSTVDAVHLADAARAVILQSRQPALAWASSEERLSVRAGSSPFADLARIPVITAVEETSNSVRFRHTIGTLRVESDWRRPHPAQSVHPASSSAPRITEVAFEGDVVTCTFDRSDERGAVPFVDVLTVTAQMAQVALYGGDAAARDASGNMWMRRASFERKSTPTLQSRQITLQLLNRRTLRVGGSPIDTIDVLARDVFGVHVTASLAVRA